jgi:MFS family permease
MFDLKDAGLIYTVFMLSNMMGRVGLSFFAGRVKASRLIFILLLITIISTAAVIFFTQKAVIFVFIVLAGIGYSGIFPLLFSTAGTIYKKGRGILVTILTVSDFLGLSIAPYLTRYVSRFSMLWSISLAIVFLGLTLILHVSGVIYKNRLRTGEVI